jgi:hypothetical protein
MFPDYCSINSGLDPYHTLSCLFSCSNIQVENPVAVLFEPRSFSRARRKIGTTFHEGKRLGTHVSRTYAQTVDHVTKTYMTHRKTRICSSCITIRSLISRRSGMHVNLGHDGRQVVGDEGQARLGPVHYEDKVDAFIERKYLFLCLVSTTFCSFIAFKKL